MLLAALALGGACRMGLPPEPPGADPADPSASAAPYERPPDPYETSAFAGEPVLKADPHAGHGTMDHAKMGHDSAQAQPQEMKMPRESPR